MLVPSTTEHETDQGVPSREGQAPQALGWVGRCGRPTPAASGSHPSYGGDFRRSIQ